MIATPRAVTNRAGGQSQGLVIAAVRRIFAPRVGRRDSADWELRLRSRCPIRPPPQPIQAEPSARRCTVAFPLVRLDAASAESNRKCAHPDGEPAAPALTYGCVQAQKTHGFALDFLALALAHGLIILAKHGFRRLLFFPRVLYFAQCRFGGSPQGVVP